MSTLVFDEFYGQFNILDGDYEYRVDKMKVLTDYLKELEDEASKTRKAISVLKKNSPRKIKEAAMRRRKLDTALSEHEGLRLYLSGKKPEYENSEWIQELKKKGLPKIEEEIDKANGKISRKEHRLMLRIWSIFH